MRLGRPRNPEGPAKAQTVSVPLSLWKDIERIAAKKKWDRSETYQRALRMLRSRYK